MIVGAYELHLYCNHCNALEQFFSAFKGGLQETVTQARAKGWRVDLGADKCYCPKHHDKASRIGAPHH